MRRQFGRSRKKSGDTVTFECIVSDSERCGNSHISFCIQVLKCHGNRVLVRAGMLSQLLTAQGVLHSYDKSVSFSAVSTKPKLGPTSSRQDRYLSLVEWVGYSVNRRLGERRALPQVSGSGEGGRGRSFSADSTSPLSTFTAYV